MNDKQNLEERTSMPIVNLVKDALKTALLNIPVGITMNYLRAPYLFEKLSLLSSKELLSNIKFLNYSYLDVTAGLFAGATDRYGTSILFFVFSFLPELFKPEDLILKMKRVGTKTSLICGGWAAAKLGKKLYEFGKYIYRLKTNRDGVDLFKDYK